MRRIYSAMAETMKTENMFWCLKQCGESPKYPLIPLLYGKEVGRKAKCGIEILSIELGRQSVSLVTCKTRFWNFVSAD